MTRVPAELWGAPCGDLQLKALTAIGPAAHYLRTGSIPAADTQPGGDRLVPNSRVSTPSTLTAPVGENRQHTRSRHSSRQAGWCLTVGCRPPVTPHAHESLTQVTSDHAALLRAESPVRGPGALLTHAALLLAESPDRGLLHQI